MSSFDYFKIFYNNVNGKNIEPDIFFSFTNISFKHFTLNFITIEGSGQDLFNLKNIITFC
jgi:hypothetical protein